MILTNLFDSTTQSVVHKYSFTYQILTDPYKVYTDFLLILIICSCFSYVKNPEKQEPAATFIFLFTLHDRCSCDLQ